MARIRMPAALSVFQPARWAAWTFAFVLALALVLGPVHGGSMGAIGIGGSLLVVLAFGAGRPQALCQRSFLLWPASVLGGAVVLIGWNALFSIDFERSFYETLRLVSIFLPLSGLAGLFALWGRALPGGVAVPRWMWLAAALCLGTGFLVLDLQLAALYAQADLDVRRLVKMNRGLTYGLLFLWPVLAFMTIGGASRIWRWSASIILMMLAFMAVIDTHSRAAQLGVGLCVLAAPLAFAAPRVWAVLWGGLLTLGGLTWPFAARLFWGHYPDKLAALPDSFRARVEIWDFLSYRIADHWGGGLGLGTTALIDPANPHGHLYRFVTGPVAHPHNYMTQLWLDLGALGVGMGLILGWGSLILCLRLPRKIAGFALLAQLMAVVLAAVAYDFWTDSFLCAMAFVCFAFWGLGRICSAR